MTIEQVHRLASEMLADLEVSAQNAMRIIAKKFEYKKIEGLRAEGISAHINEALKEMDE